MNSNSISEDHVWMNARLINQQQSFTQGNRYLAPLTKNMVRKISPLVPPMVILKGESMVMIFHGSKVNEWYVCLI